MNCPRCGSEMTLDYHRKIPLNMCYNCGYIEGRSIEGEDGQPVDITNYDHLHSLNIRETAEFISDCLKTRGLPIGSDAVEKWLQEFKK